MSLEILAGKQNPDGGWPYLRGRSWTEPTVYAILALLAAGEDRAAGRGLEWLIRTQRPDGGWPPETGVDESTWVTALVALVPEDRLGAVPHARAIRWILGLTGKETTFTYRLRERLLGNTIAPEHQNSGWPWIPGAAAWVGPTSIAMLALEKEYARRQSPQVAQRLDAGRKFLHARMCQEGGWNHGSVRALGYESLPYPETTGMALAAMRGVRSPKIDRAIAVARNFLSGCRSADAINWLRLGLLAHGQLPAGYTIPRDVSYRTCHEVSLAMVVNAFEKGRDLVWG
jgi:hypothetical protein